MSRRGLRDRLRGLIAAAQKRPLILFGIHVVDRMGTAYSGDMAASLAYFGFLSLFPLLGAAISILGFFLPSDAVQSQVVRFLESYLPGSSQLVERNIQDIVAARGVLGLVSVAGFLWTGSAVFAALERAVNRTWGTPVVRPFYLRKLRDVALAISVGLTFYLSMGVSAFSTILPALNPDATESMAEIVGRTLGFVLILATFLLVYKYMPNTVTRWRHVWPAAAITALVFEFARTVFALYVAYSARYEVIYGSLGAIAAMLVWLYTSGNIVIVGAALGAEYSRTHQH